MGPLNDGSNRCWHATMGKGEESWERGCWMLGAGERGLPRGPATAPKRHKRAFEPEGIVLFVVHSRCVLCCFISLGTSLCLAGPSISRRSVPAVENNTWYLAREFAHTHPQPRMWELILIADNHLTQSHCLVLGLSRPRVRRSWPRAAATAACFVAHAV